MQTEAITAHLTIACTRVQRESWPLYHTVPRFRQKVYSTLEYHPQFAYSRAILRQPFGRVTSDRVVEEAKKVTGRLDLK